MIVNFKFSLGEEVTWGSGKRWGKIVSVSIEKGFCLPEGEKEILYTIQNPGGGTFRRLEEKLRYTDTCSVVDRASIMLE